MKVPQLNLKFTGEGRTLPSESAYRPYRPYKLLPFYLVRTPQRPGLVRTSGSRFGQLGRGRHARKVEGTPVSNGFDRPVPWFFERRVGCSPGDGWFSKLSQVAKSKALH